MSESVPLGGCLRVKGQNVIIGDHWAQLADLLVKRKSSEQRRLELVQRPVGGDSNAVHDFFRRGEGRLGRE